LDDDDSGEVSAMFADATLIVEDRIQREPHGDALIEASPAFKEVLRQVEVVAPTDATVLLQGRPAPAKSASRALSIN
jgi:transcriptional regulator with GAF, ATPase, and Fis domain